MDKDLYSVRNCVLTLIIPHFLSRKVRVNQILRAIIKFRQGSHQVEDEFASWGCGVDLLCQADELNATLLETLEQLDQMG